MPKATTTVPKSLLSPSDHTLLLVDHQSQMAFAAQSIDGITLRTNAALVARSARVFDVATIVTTVAEKSFSGPLFPEIPKALPEHTAIDRTTMNPFEDANVVERINALGKDRLVIAGLWTSVCVAGPVLTALEQGFEVFVVTDACGDVSPEAHERAVSRMVQAGARPITALAYLLELQRDWGRARTYDAVIDVAKDHGGGYGLGIQYAKSMFGASEGGH
ncbi:hydrolase [Sandaracinus amylolyticus]|uniref:Isochorismatase family protein n=1 Tax=Sandaracinus amylolyticus TaxID=927083 RepID=A0A0F6W0J3_9BACT|nr:hydrolase [Sandaracinus amylolyticus]AKF04393.1 Isochorismatase family protein [Sandaracinus amylolyticus]